LRALIVLEVIFLGVITSALRLYIVHAPGHRIHALDNLAPEIVGHVALLSGNI
jgi:hypothetical protein